MPRWLCVATVLVLAMAVAMTSACAQTTVVAGSAQVPTMPPQPAGTAPGSVLAAEPFTGVDGAIAAAAGLAYRVRYRSTDFAAKRPTEVTGAVFVPHGTPPTGGWPVVAFAHGTTGIDPACAPSRTGTLMGSGPLIAGYLAAGYAVAATDYQGLDADAASGIRAHPYQDARTAGLNVIDSVRALRNLTPVVSTRWAAVGISQGGGASWAANDLARGYGAGLDLVGSVNLVPATDVSPLAALAGRQVLSSYQLLVYLWILLGLARTDPDFALEKYWHGRSFADRANAGGCSYQGADTAARDRYLLAMSPADLVPSGSVAIDTLTARLADLSVPAAGASAPMYVAYAGRDVYIDPEWTRKSIESECDSGSTVYVRYDEDAGHDTVDASGAVRWLADRFTGVAAPSSCGGGG
ncbi:MAG: lipase family protein [Gordonia sp. (in: high G+C Gram-positive bacteria)]